MESKSHSKLISMSSMAGKANGILSRQHAIDAYHTNPNICEECGNPILVKGVATVASVRKKRYCTRSCSTKANNRLHPKRGFEGKCKCCAIPIPSIWTYCSGCRVPGGPGRKHTTKPCPTCQADFKGANKYCSKACIPEQDYGYTEYIRRWKQGLEDGSNGTPGQLSNHIRRYIFLKFGSKCVECGWAKVNVSTGKVPLQIDHIDGNWSNNSESNLRLVCPNCHSLTATYGVLNRGKGRPRKASSGRNFTAES